MLKIKLTPNKTTTTTNHISYLERTTLNERNADQEKKISCTKTKNCNLARKGHFLQPPSNTFVHQTTTHPRGKLRARYSSSSSFSFLNPGIEK